MGHEAIFALNCNFFPLQAYLRFCGLAHEVKCRRNAEFMSPTGGWFFYLYCFWKKDKLYRAVQHLDNVLS